MNRHHLKRFLSTCPAISGWRAVSSGRVRETVRRFLSDTRGGATAIAGAAVAVMIVGGTAFVSDHAWLVDQREVLKAASNAAVVASTQELNRLLDDRPNITSDELKVILDPIAYRYVVLNLQHLPQERYDEAMSDLRVEVTIGPDLRSIDVNVSANLGGTLISRYMPLLGEYSGPAQTHIRSAAESVINPVEVVLAIDTSFSMQNSLIDNRPPRRGSGLPTRMEVVRNAALNLVDILDPNTEDMVAIGVVPWSGTVRLDTNAVGRWQSNGWARYPTRRTYGEPYRCVPANNCTPPAAIEQNVAPSPPEDWLGCMDGHRMGGVGSAASVPAASDLFTHPGVNAFAQGYFPPTVMTSYECLTGPPPSDFGNQLCFTTPTIQGQFTLANQYPCGTRWTIPTILPLRTDAAPIREAIGALEPVGPSTYSALGVLWGQHLLTHSWHDIWEGDAHPVDPEAEDSQGLRKAIVLLSDGEDSHCGAGNLECEGTEIGVSRAEACDAAKAEGTEIFVVAAMSEALVSSGLADTLRECSSEDDNPDGTYVFLNNSTAEELQAAFATIANQLRSVRRIY